MALDLPDLTEIPPTGDGILVVTYPQPISAEQRNRVVDLLNQRFPGRKWLVLDGGASVHDSSANARIEAKVDLLLAMHRTLLEQLVEEEDPGEESVQSLDGGPVHAPRDQSQSLG